MVIDTFTRRCLVFVVARKLTSRDIYRCLCGLFFAQNARSVLTLKAHLPTAGSQ